MAYSDKVIEHYENPRNVGTLDKEDPTVGTGLVGAPACGDVMRLQLKINPETDIIEDAKFKTFGCVGSNVPIAAPGKYLRADEIKIGTIVYSWDGERITTATVEAVLKRSVSRSNLMKIDFGYHHPIVVTDDHIFMGVDGNPIEAEDLAGKEVFEILEAELRGLNNVGQRAWLRDANRERLTEANPMFDPEVVSRANSPKHQRVRLVRSLDSKPQTPNEKAFQDSFPDLPLEFIGNGSLIVGNKCPDFLVTGTKKVIDLTSDVSWRLSRKGTDYESSRRDLFESNGYSYFHYIQGHTRSEDLSRFVHNGVTPLSVHRVSDGRDLRGLERDPSDKSRVIVYDFQLSGPNTYFVYRAASHNCGSAIASSSLVTEWVKGKTVSEAMELKNTQIVEELNLPPVKIHCSVLAEDAIKSAIADFRKKQVQHAEKSQEDTSSENHVP